MTLLNPQLFHGTAHDVQGDILPGSVAGHSNFGTLGHSGQQSQNHAFATTNENTAWGFAGLSRENYPGGPSAAPRLKVYQVEPNAEMKPGVFNASHPKHQGGWDEEEYIAPRFKTTGQIDTMPGRQGTFPSIDWKKFTHPDIGASDTNHPHDSDIEFGHMPDYTARVHTDAYANRVMRNDDIQQARVNPHLIPASTFGDVPSEHGQGTLFDMHRTVSPVQFPTRPRADGEVSL